MSYLVVIQELEQRQIRYEEAVARIREGTRPLAIPTGKPVAPTLKEVLRVA